MALTVVRDWLLNDRDDGVEGGKEGEGKGLERIIFCCFEAKDERAYTELIPYARLRDFRITLLTEAQDFLPTNTFGNSFNVSIRRRIKGNRRGTRPPA